MATDQLFKIQPRPSSPEALVIPSQEPRPDSDGGRICGLDVGSTTCKYVLATPTGEVLAQAYERHHTKTAEKVLEFLAHMEE